MYLSYFYNLPSGSAIVLVIAGLFVLAFLFSPSQGIFTHLNINSSTPALGKELHNLVE